MQRRDILTGVAALAGARWAGEGIDVDELTDEDESGLYTTGEFAPSGFTMYSDLEYADVVIRGDEFDDQQLVARYDYSGPFLAAEYDRDDGTAQVGFLADLTPSQARELGAALYQAAEEHEARWGGE